LFDYLNKEVLYDEQKAKDLPPLEDGLAAQYAYRKKASC
jgi:hypothetical protein